MKFAPAPLNLASLVCLDQRPLTFSPARSAKNSILTWTLEYRLGSLTARDVFATKGHF